ncbi:MAG: proline dehydrogenase family protein, partial [Cyclobacteriaceae bacterium]
AVLVYALERKRDERSFVHTHGEILKTIENAGKVGGGSFAVFKVSGIADTNLLTKVQEGKTLTNIESEKFQKAKERVMSLCEAAHQYNVGIMVDGEESWFQDVIDEMVYEAMEKFNKETAIVFNTFQLYRKDMLRLLKDAHHDAVAKGYFLGAKLVRGAYMDKERNRANEMSYPDPIQPNKAATDKDYDQALQFCINNKQRVYLVSGSHNENSNLILSELVDLHGLSRSDKRVCFSQLYGMSDHISFNLAKAGYNVVKYLPYGPVQEVIPYLSRRAKENSSITGQTGRELKLIQQEIRRRKTLPQLPKIA